MKGVEEHIFTRLPGSIESSWDMNKVFNLLVIQVSSLQKVK